MTRQRDKQRQRYIEKGECCVLIETESNKMFVLLMLCLFSSLGSMFGVYQISLTVKVQNSFPGGGNLIVNSECQILMITSFGVAYRH